MMYTDMNKRLTCQTKDKNTKPLYNPNICIILYYFVQILPFLTWTLRKLCLQTFKKIDKNLFNKYCANLLSRSSAVRNSLYAIKPDIDPVKLGRDNIKTSTIKCGSHIQLCRRNILCIHVFHYCIAIHEYIINHFKVFIL